ncbi:hypothetical protein QA640_46975 (plasmid) [Bradyrhizobium sp. CB82]|nr:hypothetical protein [Bradyrhizobium sp. CB82]WFU45554.1 hypothetical protein QA640_46975 [Bradyrhizobium sp. CB82]
MFKGAAVALLVLFGADRLLNGSQVTDGVSTMLRQIARAFGI